MLPAVKTNGGVVVIGPWSLCVHKRWCELAAVLFCAVIFASIEAVSDQPWNNNMHKAFLSFLNFKHIHPRTL